MAGSSGRGRASEAAEGSNATGMVRLERVRLAQGPGANVIQLPLVTSMFLGDRWEYLFNRTDLRLRAYGPSALHPRAKQWLEIPAGQSLIFLEPAGARGTLLAAPGRDAGGMPVLMEKLRPRQ